MSCPEFGKRGLLYLSGELNRDEASLYEKHLKECAECRKEMRSAEGIIALAGSLEDPGPSARVRRSVMRAAGRRRSPAGVPVSRIRGWWHSLHSRHYLVWGLSTAVTAVIIIIIVSNPFNTAEKRFLPAWNDDFLSSSMALEEDIDDFASGRFQEIGDISDPDMQTMSILSENYTDISERIDEINEEIEKF